MSFFGAKTTGTTESKFTTLSVQTSTYGAAVARAWGTTRITGNLIWYGDFKAIEHSESQGGKGGGISSSSYTYKTAFALALVGSPITGIPRVWSGTSKTTVGDLGLDVMTGGAGQVPWGYLSTHHPDQAISYPDLAYVAAAGFDLGSSASLPNLAFEITTASAGAGGTPDAAPWSILQDMLSMAGFPLARLGSLAQYTSWAGASGLFISPALSEQTRGADAVEKLLEITHAAAVASEGVLKIVPYGDTAVSAGGYVFSPSVTPVYALTDDDFLELDEGLPIEVTRTPPEDLKNSLRVEYKDRANEYNTGIAQARDEAFVGLYGERPGATESYDWIKTAKVASTVAYLRLQRQLYSPATYRFKLSWRFCLLEPMDIVTLTHALMGMVQVPVRITEISEDAEGALEVTAEDFPQGAGHAPLVPPQPPNGYSIDMNVSPGSAAAPVVFEPPIALAGQPEIWLASSGGDNFGGAAVWVSFDGVSYQQVGVMSGSCRHGITTGPLPYAGDPDTTSTLPVDLSVSRGSLSAASADDRDLFNTLAWVGGELVSYQNATLTGPNAYALSSLRRGAYGTPIAAHAGGVRFVRLDGRPFRYAYDAALIGRTIYIKLQAYNIYGGAFQSLEDLTPTAYTVQGAPLGAVAGLALESPFTGPSCAITWRAFPGASSYTVEVWAGTVRRRRTTGITATRFVYALADGQADGGPFRNLEFRVYAVSANGSSGSPAAITASNPQLGAPTGVQVVPAGGSISITADKPGAADYAATRIWVSSVAGFDPASTTPSYDASPTGFSVVGLKSGRYYVRVAQYDVFGTDGLVTSGEISVAVVGSNGVYTVTSLPASPADVDGQLAVFLQSADASVSGIYGWDGGAWKFTRDGANLVANSVAADRLAVSQLSAITANMGAITSGSITLDAAGFLRGGQTAYNTGTGLWMGYDGGAYKMSLGQQNGPGLTWDGSQLTVQGALQACTMSSGRLDIGGSGVGDDWGWVRTTNKWWHDGNPGWIFAKHPNGSMLAELQGGASRIRMSSWGDCSIDFPAFYVDNTGAMQVRAANVIDTLQVAGNAVTVISGAEGTGAAQISVTVSDAAAFRPLVVWLYAAPTGYASFYVNGVFKKSLYSAEVSAGAFDGAGSSLVPIPETVVLSLPAGTHTLRIEGPAQVSISALLGKR